MSTFSEKFGPEPHGATPLTEEDYLGLIPAWPVSRGDLNQLEAANILKARRRCFSSNLDAAVVLDTLFIRKLHGHMFSDVWDWAGKCRNRDLNIGADYQAVPLRVADLMADAQFWFTNQNDANLIDALACEVHHRLVSIHPFVNGNGKGFSHVCRLASNFSKPPRFHLGRH
jgi:fido (protein-threonine AMPylation protein)